MKKKILLTILVVVILAIIATVMIFVEKYLTSEKGLTKRYYKEVKEILNLEEKRKVIVMKKYDYNVDGTEDYIAITGIEKLSDVKEDDVLKDLNATLELYQNLEVLYIDGNTKEVKKYASEMAFYPEVKLDIKADEKNRYIFVSDENSGNALLLILKDNHL